MKKILLALFAVVTTVSFSYAQITKGAVFTGGSIYLQTNNSESGIMARELKDNSWGFSPQFGKAIRDNKIFGVSLGISGSRNNYFTGSAIPIETKRSGYSLGLFYRNYSAIANRFYVFGDLSLVTGISKEDQFSEVPASTLFRRSNQYGVNAALTPGFSYAVSKKTFLEMGINQLVSIGYRWEKNKNYAVTGAVVSQGKSNSFNAGININPFTNLNVGVRFILP